MYTVTLCLLLEIKSYRDKPCKCLLQIQVSETWSFWGETLRYQIKEENRKKIIIPIYDVFRSVHVEVHQNNSTEGKIATLLKTTEMILTGILLEKQPLKRRHTYKDKEP